MEHCPGQTDTEYRTEFSMWSIAASSLIVATDIRNMTDIMKEVWSYSHSTYYRVLHSLTWNNIGRYF